MMNCKLFLLPPSTKPDSVDTLKVEIKYLKEVLKCLVHTVVFQRALGSVEPEEVFVELLELHYVQCKHTALTQSVEQAVEALKDQLLKERTQHPGHPLKFIISFFQYRVVQAAFFWGGQRKEESTSPWEQWIFSLELIDSDFFRNPTRQEQLQTDVRRILEDIIKYSLSNLNHLPHINSGTGGGVGGGSSGGVQEEDPRTFPFKIGTPPSSSGASPASILNQLVGGW